MLTRQDSSTRELLQSRLRLREDVFFWPQNYGDKTWYHIESRANGRFFRVGLSEYTFISLLDGETSLGEAISLTARVLGPDAFDEEQASVLVLWLIDSGLATSGNASSQTAQVEQKKQVAKLAEKLNPFWLKLPIANPDRLIERLLPAFGWLQAWPAMVVSVLLWVAAGTCLAGNWSEFMASSRSILAPSNWLSLTAVWLALKIVHETSHALACRRLGGSVRETGLIFILLAPVAYVDVTASLRFRSKWQRIQVAAAGMWIELTISTLAVFAWSVVEAPVLRHVLFNAIFMASFTTLVFNANPLMKFDGYYILSDLLELPNLAASGTQAVRELTRRWLLGLPNAASRETGGRARIIAAYGLAASVWRVMVCCGLVIASSVLFQGLGLVLAALGCVLWVGRPLMQTAAASLRLRNANPRQFARASLRCGIAAVTAIGLLSFAPWPFPRTAPGFVEYRELAVVRAESPGFLREILVQDGATVEAGDVLITLENRELETDVGDLTAALEQSEVRHDRLVGEQKTGAAQIEDENYAAIVKRLAEKRRQLDSLTIRAPSAGRVMSRTLKWKLGTYATEGAELLSIGDEQQKEFRASLSQTDADALAGEQVVSLRLPSVGRMSANLRRINPRASHTPPHAALTSVAGGSIPVREIAAERQRDGVKFEFVEARLTADFQLEAASALTLPAGTTGQVTLSEQAYSSLGVGLYRTLHREIDRQIKQASEQ